MRRDHGTAKGLAAAAAVVLAFAACSSDTNDGGERSDRQAGTPATISHIHGLGVDTFGALYVATHYGLIKSGSAAGRWVYAGEDKDDHMGFSLHATGGVMYRSGHSRTRPSLGVESSTDGVRWTHQSDVATPAVDFHTMAVSFADAKTLWGWDSGGRGTFRSADGGATWTALTLKGVEPKISVLAGPAERNVVLAGTASGLYRSADGGATWKRILSSGAVIGVAADPDPKNAKHFLASTQRGIKVTTDGGATWKDAGGGLPAGTEITSLAISPTNPGTAYAADSSRIYTTTDGGTTWTAVPTGT